MDEATIADMLEPLKPHLNEKQWRMVLGSMARSLGRGGVSAVARAAEAHRRTVRRGMVELDEAPDPDGRVRAPGAGRPSIEAAQPGITEALESLADTESRGDPESLLRWTTKSLDELAKGLRELGFGASRSTVYALLRACGFSLQQVVKTKEGAQHPDRDAQFRYINKLAKAYLATGDPVLSVDTKKKELVGDFAQKGTEWQRSGQPVAANSHDFPAGVPKAIPYGVYNVGDNDGWVSVGQSADTSQFAVNTLRHWWHHVGRERYGDIDRLLITADAGGSNGYNRRLWKVELAAFAAETGISVTVAHYPPGTSKWNKIEHKLFAFISKRFRGRPLTSYQVILSLIANTTTESGLQVEAYRDQNEYPTGIKISDAELAAVPLERHEFHPDWNYTIHPE
jgi:hypothetical protein